MCKSAVARPLTDDEREDVAGWVALIAGVAIKQSKGLDGHDLEDAIGEAFYFACKSVRTWDSNKAKLCTHMGSAARFGAMAAHDEKVRSGFGGLKGRTTVASVIDAVPTKFELDEAIGFAGDAEPDPVELPREVQHAIANLPDRLRVAIEWRYKEGLPLHEVGLRMGVSKERARQVIEEALHRIRLDIRFHPQETALCDS